MSLEQIYLWKRNSIYKTPWQRQLFNIDFLKYEQKRIKDVLEWHKKFQKVRVGEELDEVYYYVNPIELRSDWKAALALKGNYNFFSLSALKNSSQMPLMMIIAQDKKQPSDYSLIRILKSKKDYVHNENTNEVEYIINVEEFEDIDPSYVYLDVPHEKRFISKFIKENIVNDDIIANSLQPTISSAPYIINSKGGISLSAFLTQSSFSDELIKTLKMIQPPEFTDLQFQLPATLLKGNSSQPLSKGITFHVSERNVVGRNFFNAFSTNDYNKLNDELVKRSQFFGEYSIMCSLNPRGDNPSAILKDILSKFVRTEITQPFNTDELRYWDVDLTRTQRNIDEDLWLQIAEQRQKQPVINSEGAEIIKLRQELMEQWKVIFGELGIKKNTEHEIKALTSASLDNITRVAQSIARDEQQNKVTETQLTKSYKIFIENSESLVQNPLIQHNINVIIPEMRENKRFNAVRIELSIQTLDLNQLFEKVKEYFKDAYELQEYIDKLKLAGDLFEPKRGIYEWVL